MPGPPDIDPRAVLSADRTQWITKRLLGYVLTRTQNMARAKDLAQQSILLVLEGKGWHRWEPDPAKTPEQSLLDHLCDIARSTGKDENKSAAVRRIARPDPDDPERDERVRDPAPTAESARVEAEHLRDMRRASRVMDALDPLARALLTLEEQGVHDAATQADLARCSVSDVYVARKRIARQRDAVLRDEQDEEGGST
jgi:DNA-directed RNA polymerase specialized sigma24 family protein